MRKRRLRAVTSSPSWAGWRFLAEVEGVNCNRLAPSSLVKMSGGLAVDRAGLRKVE
jgi:hypothetical protein